MSDNNPQIESKQRPFPWRCPQCRVRAVFPAVVPYQTSVKYGSAMYCIDLPLMEIPRCQSCGEMVFTSQVDEQINAQLREKAGLLKPDEMRKSRERLGLTRPDVAARLGVPEQQFADWEDDIQIPSREMDNLMRVHFALPEIRAVHMSQHNNLNPGVFVG